MSREELIKKLKRITHENTDLLCDFCKYESECQRGVKSYAGEPWFPPCADLDIDKYIDFDSVEEFEEESEVKLWRMILSERIENRMCKEDELRIVRNFIDHMPKTYRKHTMNFKVIQNILMEGTSHMGMTSCCKKCVELGIDPYKYTLESEDK